MVLPVGVGEVLITTVCPVEIPGMIQAARLPEGQSKNYSLKLCHANLAACHEV